MILSQETTCVSSVWAVVGIVSLQVMVALLVMMVSGGGDGDGNWWFG